MEELLVSTPRRLQSCSYMPLPEPLLTAITSNDPAALHSRLLHFCLDVDSFFLWTDKQQTVVLRTMLQLASFHAAPDVVGLLLALGADPSIQSPDDQTTALHCACSNPSSSATTKCISALVNAGAKLDSLDKHGRTPRDLLPLQPAEPSNSEDEMQDDCYKTDEFRMYSFKVELCQRLDEQHDWTTCCFMHPGEKARRRDPRVYKYNGVPCPDFRKGSCKRGDACTYAHGVFECWLHPARYRTQLCKEGALCKRGVCFFAHSMDELREPLFLHGEKPTAGSQPESPKGPLTPCMEPSSDGSSRSSSPDPIVSREALSSGGSFSSGSSSMGRAPGSRRDSLGGGSVNSKLRQSAESSRGVLSRAHSISGSSDSSLSCTPVLDSSLGSCLPGSDLARSLSSLSLVSEETVHAAAAAAAAAAVAALGVTTPQPAPAWGLGGLQVPSASDVLSFQLAAARLQQLQGLPALGQCMLPDQSAVLQAAALQHSLALAQAQQDPAAALLAAAGIRQPLQALSMNLGHHPFHPAPTPYPSCFGL